MTARVATIEDQAVGARITALRKARGLTQTDLGTAAGVTFQQIQKYEKGTNRIGASRLQEIARILKVPVSRLYDGETGAPEQHELVDLFLLPGAAELLKAFAEIKNTDLRRNILALASTAARISTGPVAGNG